jgi:glucokinase
MAKKGKQVDARDKSGEPRPAPGRAAAKLAIVADIGGTNTRVALAEAGRPGCRPELGRIVKLANDAHESLDELLAAAVDALGAAGVATAVLAVAGPVMQGDVPLTNRAWTLRRGALAARFGWSRLVVINDFAAVARSLPGLTAQDVTTLAPGLRDDAAALLAVGPGTGLGVGAFCPGPDGAGAMIASEAGHMSFGASNPAENRIFATLQAEQGFVRAETVLCGPGLTRLYAAMAPEAGLLPAAAIAQRLAAGDAAARAVVAMFFGLLGRFAGDLALAFRASGGVFLTGGVLLRLSAHADLAPLVAGFRGHRDHEAWLLKVPIHLIKAAEPGLLGCAALADAAGTPTGAAVAAS